MIAAIYARKSTEQNGVTDEEKSVTRQVEHAKAYAARKRWTVAEEHIYADDGISGAEFVKRPGFLRLMNALKPRPSFQVLIMSEESRLGREQIETGYALKQIMDGGVRVFFYLEDRERTLDSAMDKVMLSLTNFAAEMEREKARQRTYDAMARKAKAGYVAGGKVYGYDNREILSPARAPDGRHRRLHVERRVDEAEAGIIRRIFEMTARGAGLVKLAKTLNAEGIRSPRGNGWAPSAIREMLSRDLYRGQLVWNKTRRVDRAGTQAKRARPDSEWVTLETPELRIVSEELWLAVQARREQARSAYVRTAGGRLWGRPAGTLDSPYLLTGLARCGLCRGAVFARKRTHGGHQRMYYGCMSYHLRGRHACPNNQTIPMDVANAVFLQTIRDEVLTPALVDHVIVRALELHRAEPEPEHHRATLDQELRRLHLEIRRYTDAIGQGEPLPSVLEALRERERRRAEIQAQREYLEGLERITRGLDSGGGLRKELASRLTDWQGLLERQPVVARQMLRKLLVGRLVFTPRQDEQGGFYEFTGQASYGRLLAGIVNTNLVVPPG